MQSVIKNDVTKKNLNNQWANNTWGGKNISAGVNPTPIIANDPNIPNTAAIIAVIFSLCVWFINKLGVNKKNIDSVNPAITIDILKHKHE